MSKTLVLVEDEILLLETMQDILVEYGYQVVCFRTFEDFIFRFEECNADLIMTDLNLPGENGVELILQIRQKDPLIPIIMISGKKTTQNEVKAIRSGANDFIGKPVDFNVLVAKIEALLEQKKQLEWKDIQIDPPKRIVYNEHGTAKLTVSEFSIFMKLMKKKGDLVAREPLSQQLQGKSLDVHVHSLRRKIKSLGLNIETLKGKGYRLDK